MKRKPDPAAIRRAYFFALSLMAEEEAVQAVAESYNIEPATVRAALETEIA